MKRILPLLLVLILSIGFNYNAEAKVKTFELAKKVQSASTLSKLGTYKTTIEEDDQSYFILFTVPEDGEYMYKVYGLKSKSGFDKVQTEVRVLDGNRIFFGKPVIESTYLSQLRRSLGKDYTEEYLHNAKLNIATQCTQTLEKKLSLKKDKVYQIEFKGKTLNERKWKKCTVKLGLSKY